MITDQDILFEVSTPLGFSVRATKEYWQIITERKHPVMRDKRDLVEEIVIGENIHLTVVRIEGGKVRLGVVAPSSVCVHREEIRGRQPSVFVRAASKAAAGMTAAEKN